jgi:integrase
MARRKPARRRFGMIRRLPSGRFQASFRDPNGVRRNGSETFASRTEANDWLIVQESLLVRGEWTDPDRGKVPFAGYADRWIQERAGLRPRTREFYRWLLSRYLQPSFGRVHLTVIDPPMVRTWRTRLLDAGVSKSMVAKAYRLLRSILMTAVEQDELIRRNPCRIVGAGTESPDERPVLSIEQVCVLADLMPARQRMLIMVATFASLRYGEVTALRRMDIDLARGAVSVRQAFSELRGQGMVLGPPKSRAGLRTVGLPSAIVPKLRDHLAQFVSPEPTALVFTGPKGAPIRRSNFNPLVGWLKAAEAIGAPGLHFHDLRHTGNTLAAATGVSTRDLMARMGHDSMNAAIIYQHATREADRVIADGLDARLGVLREPAKKVAPDPDEGESRGLEGTEVARELHEGRF